METIQSILASRLLAAVGDSGGMPVTVQSAQDARFGDYQSNVAMQLAKPRRANPRQLATEIIAKLQVDDLCEKPEIAGAGFINFRLKPTTIVAYFTALATDERLGVPSVPQRRIVIDFSSPNVAKPMHVGHIRSTFLGDALARIGRFLGHTVVTDNHIGDWGKQFGMLLVGWKTIRNDDALDKDAIAEMERIYKTINKQIFEETFNATKPAKNADDVAPPPITEIETKVSDELVKLQSGDEENLGIWREMIRLSQVQFDTIYARLGVKFDLTLGESFYNPWLKEVAADLLAKGIARESDGALCVFSDRSLPEKDDPFLIKDENGWKDAPALVQKADGASNYTTTDLATLDYRSREISPDEIIYVTDGRQQLHFRQLFAIWRRWQPRVQVKLAHVWFGSILGEDGKPFKTRSGDTVKLADLLDEALDRAEKVIAEKNPDMPEAERHDIARIIGLGAVKYADLLPNRQGDYVFSWEKMLSFQGNTAPYLQYSYVRIRSIFRKAADLPVTSNQSPVTFTEPAELALAKKIAQFGEIVPTILDDYRPNLLCNYLYELAGAFHSFFENCPVLKAEESVRNSRLLLCDTAARVLAKGLDLLGIGVPERM
jgi:arginyl-tRNA synthetase